VPVEKAGLTGRCGRCRAELPARGYLASAPVEISDGKFDLVTRLAAVPVLVDFWAAWCAPCQQMAPILEQLARDLQGRLMVAKLDTERNPATPMRFGVQAIPTLVLLRSGIEVDRITGLLPLPGLRDRLERFL
jgi:thioredoxin 2